MKLPIHHMNAIEMILTAQMTAQLTMAVFVEKTATVAQTAAARHVLTSMKTSNATYVSPTPVKTINRIVNVTQVGSSMKSRMSVVYSVIITVHSAHLEMYTAANHVKMVDDINQIRLMYVS